MPSVRAPLFIVLLCAAASVTGGCGQRLASGPDKTRIVTDGSVQNISVAPATSLAPTPAPTPTPAPVANPTPELIPISIPYMPERKIILSVVEPVPPANATKCDSLWCITNPEPYTCYYRVTSKRGSEVKTIAQNQKRPPGFFGGVSTYNGITSGCAGAGSAISCGSTEVTVEIFAGAQALCNFSVNVPGQDMMKVGHSVATPYRLSLKQETSDDMKYTELLTRTCDAGEQCYSIAGVQLSRISQNKFRFVTGDIRGFTYWGTENYAQDYLYNSWDYQFKTYFNDDLMQGLR